MKKLILSLGILLASLICFAEGGIKEVLLTGTSQNHGEYVVYDSEEKYYYMGNVYNVFHVKYEDTTANMRIGVCGKKYVAYNDEFTAFYECTRHGFGIRKIYFSSPTTRDKYSGREFNKQTILCKERKIDEIQAIGLMALYVPELK